MYAYFKSRAQVFKYPAYLWFILNCSLAMFGNGLIYIISAWLVLKYSPHISAVIILIMCFWLPILLLSPLAGVIADRYSRKNVILITNLLRALLLFILTSIFHQQLTPNVIYLIALVNGVLGSIYVPSAMALVREIVPPKQLLSANATLDMAYETGNLLGMASAGFILKFTSEIGALYLNASLFLIAALCLLGCKKKYFINPNILKKIKYSPWQDFINGLKYISQHRKTLLLYILQLIQLSAFMTAPVIMAPFAKFILNVNLTQFSLIEASMGLGSIIGGIYTPFIQGKIGFISTVRLYTFLQITCFSLIVFARDLILINLLYFVIGFGFTIWAVIITQAQNSTALDFQGRVQSSFFSISGLFVLIIYGTLALIGQNLSLNYTFFIEVFILLFSLLVLRKITLL